jgi:putative MATE family efflux protein
MKKVQQFIKNPKKALFQLALPIIIGMFVQTMYNVVDTAYIGRLGAEAIAALTFSFPLFFILIAVNSGLASGMGARISRYLGEKKKAEAENTAMHGLIISLVLSVVIFIIGSIFLRRLFVLFGASPTVTELAMQYMFTVLLGIFFFFPSTLMSNILSAQGDTKTSMIIQISALILNAILDPIFIYPMGLGVKGAAIATDISFMLALVLAMYFIRKKSHLHIHRSSFHYSPKLVKEIFSIGMPATLVMLIMSFYVIFLNGFMAHFSVKHVAAFGMASRLESVATMPLVGLSLASLTLVGMFYGAKRYDLVKSISWYSIRIGVIIATAGGLLFFIFRGLFLRVFTPDISLLKLSAGYLMIDVFTFPFIAVTIIVSRIMQGMGYGMPGLIVNLIRVFFVAVPAAFLFIYVLNLGYLSVAVAMLLGGIAASITAFFWLRYELNALKEKQ